MARCEIVSAERKSQKLAACNTPRHSSAMRIKQREVYTSRYFRHGNSYAVIIPPDIRELMGLIPGDNLALNFQHGVLWAVKITPGMIASREKVAAIFDELFPSKDGNHARQ